MELPFEVLAYGVITTGGSPGDKIQNCHGCTVTQGSTGQIQIDVDDLSAADQDRVSCLLGPSWGSAPSFGVTYGLAGPVPIIVATRRADDQALVDIPFSFFIIRFAKFK